ncbi:MAG: 1-(5-phosphoribosyl)-5-[(5-phosphoribosylamino)methylideneamino]imidazole-4-carboxamide isomerase [Candidatus Omnitrophica bacterium]|nr:1-(5-phosphoribosyl)-5-[(5-phosphoribosylamino)methylideneamino]imidazole-4-carboxamide isomerase [Candidatus Omnitrophota bacterium]
MTIIPAIDLYQQKVVRLIKGEQSNCKIYSNDPVSVAKKWQSQGAKWLHLVDLSAAFSEGDNRDIIEQIIKEVDISIEVGGGIRTLGEIEKLLSIGVKRVILGTKATQADFLKKAKDLAGSKIAVAVDEKKGKVAISGWQKQIDLSIEEYLIYLKEQGIDWIIYTDVSRDGTLEGMDLSKIKQFLGDNQFNIIFSGGISCLEDIKRLKIAAPGAKGVIVGKALYEEKFKLREALLI